MSVPCVVGKNGAICQINEKLQDSEKKKLIEAGNYLHDLQSRLVI